MIRTHVYYPRSVNQFGNFGFPWLLVANIGIAAGKAGWDYFSTRKQIQDELRKAPTEIPSPTDIQAISHEVRRRTGTRVPESDLQKYLSSFLVSNPPSELQIPPSQFLSQGQPWQSQSQSGGLPTWGWALLGVAGFLILQKRGTI